MGSESRCRVQNTHQQSKSLRAQRGEGLSEDTGELVLALISANDLAETAHRKCFRGYLLTHLPLLVRETMYPPSHIPSETRVHVITTRVLTIHEIRKVQMKRNTLAISTSTDSHRSDSSRNYLIEDICHTFHTEGHHDPPAVIVVVIVAMVGLFAYCRNGKT